jgi:hypothetical protein
LNSKTALILVAGLAIAAPLPSLGQQIYAYPTKGQTPEQQTRDQQECIGWAVQQVGTSPYSSNKGSGGSGSSGGTVAGGMVRGAAGGAALGAVGGAIAGNAGKGAAIGAGTGALFGGVKQHSNRKRNNQSNQGQQSNAAYQRALGACLQGRGYSVQ